MGVKRQYVTWIIFLSMEVVSKISLLVVECRVQFDLCKDVTEGRVWEADGEEALTTDAEENVHDG